VKYNLNCSRRIYLTANLSVLWGSIGYSVGAALGCALAAKEQNDRRVILFVGDGSLQLTLQEIGTMIRRGLNPYIFVLNNDGYEIER
jgi:pyruvate decarboxylase